jgi:alcohol dehydrogenase class IV
MDFNKDVCASRLAALCDVIYPEQSGEAEAKKADIIIRRIAEIVANTKIPVSLKEFGITEENLEDLVLAGSQQQRLLMNNIKELSLDDIRAIYRKVI